MTVVDDLFDTYLDTPKANDELIFLRYNPNKAFTLDFMDLWNFNESMASILINEAPKSITAIQDILKSRLNYPYTQYIKIVNFPEETQLRKLNGIQMGKLVKISGIVTSVSEKTLQLTKALYVCEECGNPREVNVRGQFLPNVGSCPNCKEGKMILDPMKGESKEVQWITLQERVDETPPGQPPQTIKITLEEDAIYQINPGDNLSIVGYLKGMRKSINDPTPNIFIYLTVSSYNKDQKDFEVEITEEDKTKLRKITSDIGYTKKLIESIAPTLYGLENEKLSIALQQCGGNTIEIEGEHKRGNIHILLAGDAGEGKSALLDFAVKMNPRSIKTVGPGATNAGLTAATIKDGETGKYTLVAGAMVLADGGLVAADEFDKMRKEDRGAMHSAMEEQTVNINKGGFNASMRSRCSILAACNPYGGQWNTSQTLLENIKNFPPALVTRFDLIWILINNRTVNEEMIRVRHVLKNRFHTGEVQPPYNRETLRKLFAYAKTITPKVSLEAENRIEGFYEEVLKAGKKTDSTLMTMRMLEGIARLTEASAKLHLREEATVEDAELVIKLMKESLLQSGIDPITGLVDASLLETGVSSTLRGKMESYLATLRQVGNMSIDHLVKEEDVESALIGKGFKADEVKKIQGILMRDSTIFSPRPHFIKIT